jgi:hypothetical protein
MSWAVYYCLPYHGGLWLRDSEYLDETLALKRLRSLRRLWGTLAQVKGERR